MTNPNQQPSTFEADPLEWGVYTKPSFGELAVGTTVDTSYPEASITAAEEQPIE